MYYDLDSVITEFKKIKGIKNKQTIFKQGFVIGFGMGFITVPVVFLALLGVMFVLRTCYFNWSAVSFIIKTRLYPIFVKVPCEQEIRCSLVFLFYVVGINDIISYYTMYRSSTNAEKFKIKRISCHKGYA